MRARPRTLPLLLAFGHLGLLMGLWGAEIATVKERTGLSARGLGVVLVFLPLGTMVGLPLSRRLLMKPRHGTVLAASVIAAASMLLTALNTRGRPMIGVELLLFGIAMCQVNVAANHYGARLEAVERRPLMSGLHAPFGYGLAAGAGLSYVSHLASVRHVVIAVAVVGLTVVGAVACLHLTPIPTAAVKLQPGAEPSPDRSQRASVLLGVVSMTCGITESGFSDWIGVYLHLQVGTTTAVAALGFTIFAVALTLGRTVGDRVTARIGNVRMVRWSGALATAGILTVLLSPGAIVALPGVILTGLGLSSLSPRIMSAAGQNDDDATSLIRVIGLSTVGGFAGPPILGTASAALGLPAALAIPALGAAAVSASARIVDHRQTVADSASRSM